MNVATNGANRRSSMQIVESAKVMTQEERTGEELAKRMLEAVSLAYAPTDSSTTNNLTNSVVQQLTDNIDPIANSRRQSISTEMEQVKLCRIFDSDAIKVPGVMYKTVGIKPSMSSQAVITEALGKFGSFVDPKSLELRFAPDPDRMGVKKSKKKKQQEPSKVVADDECPLLVVEWYTDIPRRFEIHSKSNDGEKLIKKWTNYWHSPAKTSRGKSVRTKKSTMSVKKKSNQTV